MRLSEAEREAACAMAEHFLDTETRHRLPGTALACVRGGLDVRAARRAWRTLAFPTVGMNFFDVVGEWMGWDPVALRDSIERTHRSWFGRVPFARWAVYALFGWVCEPYWRAIARLIRHLEACPPSWRPARAAALEELLRYGLDFARPKRGTTHADVVAQMRRLRVMEVMSFIEPTLLRDERRRALEAIDARLAPIRLRS